MHQRHIQTGLKIGHNSACWIFSHWATGFFCMSSMMDTTFRQLYLALVISLVLLMVSILLGFGVQTFKPEMITLLLGDYQRDELLRHYQDASLDTILHAGLSERMDQWLFYCVNNMGIGLKTFLAGILAGVGAFLLMGYFGFSLGCQFAYLQQQGVLANAWSLVLPHSALELAALALAAASGLLLGLVLLRRLGLRLVPQQGAGFRHGLLLLALSMILFALAGALEAFVSSSMSVPAGAKLAGGLLLWCLLLGGLLFYRNKI